MDLTIDTPNPNLSDPNPKPPLNLPVGSVRALLALSMVAVSGIGILIGKSLPDWWTVLVALTVKFYFDSRP